MNGQRAARHGQGGVYGVWDDIYGFGGRGCCGSKFLHGETGLERRNIKGHLKADNEKY